ncbi:MAG: dienelactone hydrolase family protein [Aquabacterium sp.]|nr:dienelactone hydrolase family protein [Aquabacterium sp.]
MNSHRRMTVRLAIAAMGLSAGLASAQSMEVFSPQSGSAPGVILISGISGTALYQDYARAVADLGYTAALVSGRDVSPRTGGPADNLRNIVATLRRDSRVKPGKLAVVGFSLGGGGALLHASGQSETFSAVVAYYPAISNLPNITEIAKRVGVPTLILSGEKDRYNNCCLIESMREFEAAARTVGLLVELHTYPEADHGFNLKVPTFRAHDAADAWSRVQEFLRKHHPQ